MWLHTFWSSFNIFFIRTFFRYNPIWIRKYKFNSSLKLFFFCFVNNKKARIRKCYYFCCRRHYISNCINPAIMNMIKNIVNDQTQFYFINFMIIYYLQFYLKVAKPPALSPVITIFFALNIFLFLIKYLKISLVELYPLK